MKLSVIVPVYNSEAYLEACLDSILQAISEDSEIVCIDDGSQDRSSEILAHYQKIHGDKIQNIKVVNGGQAKARNLGITKAKGEYIAFVDSDDTVDPTLFQKLFQAMENSDADLVFCEIDRIFTAKKKGLASRYQFDTGLSLTKQTTIFEHPEIICFLTGAPYGKLIKKAFLIENGIQFLSGYIYEDQMFTQSLLSCNPKIVQVKEKLYRYYVRENSTMTSKKSRVEDMFHVYDCIYEAYKNKGLQEHFAKELEYLCLYHVLIGTSFRLWSSKQASLFQAIRKCRKYCRGYHCGKSNLYLKRKGFVSTLFVKIFL